MNTWSKFNRTLKRAWNNKSQTRSVTDASVIGSAFGMSAEAIADIADVLPFTPQAGTENPT